MTQDHKTYIWGKRFQVLHMALANKLYHQRCASIFEARERWSKLVSLVGSSAAFVSVSSAEVSQAFAVLAFSGAAASLVFRWAEKARIANEKMQQYSAIYAEIVRVGEYEFSDKDIYTWEAALASINETAPNTSLWETVCNEAALSLGSPDAKEPSWLSKASPPILIP